MFGKNNICSKGLKLIFQHLTTQHSLDFPCEGRIQPTEQIEDAELPRMSFDTDYQ